MYNYVCLREEVTKFSEHHPQKAISSGTSIFQLDKELMMELSQLMCMFMKFDMLVHFSLHTNMIYKYWTYAEVSDTNVVHQNQSYFNLVGERVRKPKVRSDMDHCGYCTT